jgi:hypothetical protein
MLRALLVVACAAAFLATGALGYSDSKGEASCGALATWSIPSGQDKRCCTNSLLGSVNRFKYTVEPARGEEGGRKPCVVQHARRPAFTVVQPLDCVYPPLRTCPPSTNKILAR